MAVDLYSLAGSPSTGSTLTSGVGSSLGALAFPLSAVSGPAGVAAGILGGVMKLGGTIAGQISRKKAGKKMFGEAKETYEDKLAAKPYLYSDAGTRSAYAKAESSLADNNRRNTSALMDRYSSIQKRQLRNSIKSGATSGAAAANAIQSNMAFQKSANDLFGQQGQAVANLELQKQQALEQKAISIDGRKNQLADRSLLQAGIYNTAARGGLASKLM